VENHTQTVFAPKSLRRVISRWIDPRPGLGWNMSMKWVRLAGVGLAMAASPGLAQAPGRPAHQPVPSHASPETPPAPAQASSPEPQEISHEEMVKEQERRDREAEAERDRDDQ
jgi:hypothetical protein